MKMRNTSNWVLAVALAAGFSPFAARAQTAPPVNGGPPTTELNGGAPNVGLSGGSGTVGLSGGTGGVGLSGGPGSVTLSGGNGMIGAAMLPGPLLPFNTRPTPLPGALPPISGGLTPLPGSTPAPGLSVSRPGLKPSTPVPVAPTP